MIEMVEHDLGRTDIAPELQRRPGNCGRDRTRSVRERNAMNSITTRKVAYALAGAGLAVLIGVPPVAAEEIARPAVPVTPAAASLAATLPLATKPALALEVETAAPIQAVVHAFGDRHVLAYYTRGADRCDLVLMTNEEPGPRVRVSLAPEQTATIEDVSGGTLGLTCGAGAVQMTVERRLAPQEEVVAR
jgi:hypothetical protein